MRNKAADKLCVPRFPSAEALEVDAFSPSISTFSYDAVTAPNIIGIRNAGSTSNLGGTTLRGHFFLKERGAFSKIERALLCLLQNLGGARAPNAPGQTSMIGKFYFLGKAEAWYLQTMRRLITWERKLK